jgi:hypothetical protein
MYIAFAAMAAAFAVYDQGIGFVLCMAFILFLGQLWATKDAEVKGKRPSAPAFHRAPTRRLRLNSYHRVCRAICNACDEDARSECQCRGDGQTECSDVVYHPDCKKTSNK